MRVALYLRYSSDNQDEATIETQRTECVDKAVRLWPTAVIVVEYIDTAQSGKIENRPEFQRMIQDSKKSPRPWDVLMVRKFDRFARDVTVSRVYKSMLRRQGIKVISAREEIDTDSATGKLLEIIIEAVAAFYSENLAIETRSGMATNTKRGFRCGGTAPFGYKNKRVIDPATGKERTALEINEDEAPTVRLIFELVAKGSGLRAVVSELNARKMSPREATSWHATTIRNLLRYPTYRGDLLWRSKTGDVVSEGGCPRLVDDDTWQTVQARLEKVAGQHPRITGSAHPLSGMIFCGVCGSPFIVRGKSNGEYRLCCAKRNRNQCENQNRPAESLIVDTVKRELVQTLLVRGTMEQMVKDFVSSMRAEASDREKEIAPIRKKEERLQRQISVLMGELSLGEIPREFVMEKLTELRAEREEIQKSLKESEEFITRARETEAVPLGDVDEILSLAKKRILAADASTIKEVFEGLCLRVEVHANSLKILTAPLSESREYMSGAGSPRLSIYSRTTIPNKRRPAMRLKV